MTAVAGWRGRAACLNTDVELFYPLTEAPGAAIPAKHVCWDCPVRRECLGEAMRRRDGYGIWGGLNVHERERVRKAARWDTRLARNVADALADPDRARVELSRRQSGIRRRRRAT
jgi:WhiB family redox-sensing transcriptional regulator